MPKIFVAALLLFAALSSPAFAQLRPKLFFAGGEIPQRDVVPMEPNGLERGIYESANYPSVSRGGETREEFRQRIMEERRTAEKARRERARQAIPTRFYADEDRAASRFKIAHLLWQAGRLDASRMTLAKLIDEFSGTEAADRARVVLARL